MARILVVDDEASDRLVMEAILGGAGHEVVLATGGEAGLRSVLKGGVDLVVTDLRMGDVHGFELISILRDLEPTPPVIAVSGTGEFQLHMARKLGAQGTVCKPVDQAELLRAVQTALGTS